MFLVIPCFFSNNRLTKFLRSLRLTFLILFKLRSGAFSSWDRDGTLQKILFAYLTMSYAFLARLDLWIIIIESLFEPFGVFFILLGWLYFGCRFFFLSMSRSRNSYFPSIVPFLPFHSQLLHHRTRFDLIWNFNYYGSSYTVVFRSFFRFFKLCFFSSLFFTSFNLKFLNDTVIFWWW